MPRPTYRPGETARFMVKPRSGKKPLSVYLASRLGVVELRAAELLAAGAVALDGVVADRDTHINLSSGGHEIVVNFPLDWPKHMVVTEMPLSILHEDAEILVLDKPPGIVVHPARGHLEGNTLQNGVRYRYRDRLGRPGVTIGPPHRLDKDTSGAVVFALTTSSYIEMVRQFTAGEPWKTYLALLDGEPDFTETTVCWAIGTDPDNPKRGKLAPVEEGGKPAKTRFRILARGGGMALAEAAPFTGRPHQIRLHAAGLGCPVVGDRDYHLAPERHGAARQALHAAELSFIHPGTGERLTLRAPLPDDMRRLLRDAGMDDRSV